MTALPSSNIVGRTDAELASAAAAGDRGAFAGIYDRYADRLHDFCVGMLRDREAAADCVQDVFCAAATRLGQLREPDKLRPWLYAIARNEALRQIRERRREELYEEVPDMASRNPGPDTLAARGELADLIAEAAGGLSDRDRSVLELAYRHGLDGPELADVLGVSPVNANVMVYRLRETIERSLGALLVARGARRNPTRCPELAAILVGWDGAFTVLMRKRIARHIESCSVCEQDRRRLVNPVALLGGAPVFIPAPAWLRAHTLNHIQLVAASTGMPTGAPSSQLGSQSAPQPQHSMHRPWSGTPGATTLGPGDNNVAAVDEDLAEDVPGRASGHLLLLIALFAATLIASAGLTILWLSHPNDAIPPTGLRSATPPPPPPPPPPPGSTRPLRTQSGSFPRYPRLLIRSRRAFSFPPRQLSPTYLPLPRCPLSPRRRWPRQSSPCRRRWPRQRSPCCHRWSHPPFPCRRAL
jgi:RNA polymerase sigma factor (sigma-70 family)